MGTQDLHLLHRRCRFGSLLCGAAQRAAAGYSSTTRLQPETCTAGQDRRAWGAGRMHMRGLRRARDIAANAAASAVAAAATTSLRPSEPPLRAGDCYRQDLRGLLYVQRGATRGRHARGSRPNLHIDGTAGPTLEVARPDGAVAELAASCRRSF